MVMMRVSPEFRKKIKKIQFDFQDRFNRKISEEELSDSLEVSFNESKRKTGKLWHY
jgi:mRNA-degrading endonuclease RelE of RelBE toxin-antitoxin system